MKPQLDLFNFGISRFCGFLPRRKYGLTRIFSHVIPLVADYAKASLSANSWFAVKVFISTMSDLIQNTQW